MVEFMNGDLDAVLRAVDAAALIDPAGEHASRTVYKMSRAWELQDKETQSTLSMRIRR